MVRTPSLIEKTQALTGKSPALIAKLQKLWQTPALMVRAPALTAKKLQHLCRNSGAHGKTSALIAKTPALMEKNSST